jgi:hypothetical protein
MPSRKPVKPVQEPTASEAARHTNALLEKLRAEFKVFKVFGEGLNAVRNRADNTFDQVGRNTEAIGRLEDRLKIVQKDVGGLKVDVSELKADVKEVKARLHVVESHVN